MKKIYETTIIVFVLFLAASWGLFQFMYMPMTKDLDVLKSTINQHKARNSRIKELAEQPDFFEGLVTKVGQYHEEIKQQLPRSIKLSALLRELSAMARKNNITIVSIKPIGSQPYTLDGALGGNTNGYIKSEVQIIFESTYQGLADYVKSVEKNDLTIMTIKDLSLGIDRESSNNEILQGNLSIEAFYRDV